MGKSTISTGPFSIAMLVYQRVMVIGCHRDFGKDHPPKDLKKSDFCDIKLNGYSMLEHSL